jgi:hypothetical protein
MKLRSVALLLTFILAGCATTPPRPNPSVVEREIVKSVLQEVCAAVINIQGLRAKGDPAAGNEHFTANNGWMAAIETSLKTDVEASGSPSFTLLGPFLPAQLVGKGGTAGSYNASVGGTLDQTASVLRDDKRYIVLDTLLKDDELCPPANSPQYLAYYEDQASYQSRGKYLAGTLGIRDWLYNAVAAQDFRSIAGPRTTVAEGPLQNDITTKPAIRDLTINDRLSADLFSSDVKKNCQPNDPITVTKGALPDWYLVQGQQVSNYSLNNPFMFCEGLDKLTYSLSVPVTGPNPLPLVLTTSPDKKKFIFNSTTVPATISGTLKATITATDALKKRSAVATFDISVYPAPKATAFAPTYSATFTFTIKATGQLGPAFTLDRVKGGGTTFFSGSRTETSYVNIVMTATGVPLVEVNPDGSVVGRGNAKAIGAPGYVDAVDKAIKRLDDALLNLNISKIRLTP